MIQPTGNDRKCNREMKENRRTWVLQCCKSFGLPGSGCSLPIQHGQAHHHWCRQSGPHHWPVLYPRHQPRLGRKQKAQHDEQVSSQKHDRTILNVKICYFYVIVMLLLYMGVSENSVPLNPLVNDHYPYEKWLFHWEYTQHFQTNPYNILQ